MRAAKDGIKPSSRRITHCKPSYTAAIAMQASTSFKERSKQDCIKQQQQRTISTKQNASES